jgi:threonylcarbamoyladenosine tRNA methylthiotransferase MtaB
MKVYLDSIGCRLNQSEIDTYAQQFALAGYELAITPEQADLVVINTCTVTSAAASDSRGKIRRAYRAGAKEILVTGCWSTLNQQQAMEMPGVVRVVDNQVKDNLVADLLQLPEEDFEVEIPRREALSGVHQRTRRFIKVQDGCDNHCTYCITRLARGKGRSRSIREVLGDIHRGLNDGRVGSDRTGNIKEVVLTGVHLGSWGQDFSPPLHLKQLVQAILDDCDVPRVRLSSLEPWDLEGDFFDLWKNPRMCRQLHLPLQSGSAAVLQRMGRNTDPVSYARLVETARQSIADVAITTDIIVGFPGESEAEFEQSLGFVEKMQFARGHVFTYSARPGTAASKMTGQVAHELRKQRNLRMRVALGETERMYQERLVGRRLMVLWETDKAHDERGWLMSGLTDNYLRVHTWSDRSLWNQVTGVMLTGLDEHGLWGEICED